MTVTYLDRHPGHNTVVTICLPWEDGKVCVPPEWHHLVLLHPTRILAHHPKGKLVTIFTKVSHKASLARWTGFTGFDEFFILIVEQIENSFFFFSPSHSSVPPSPQFFPPKPSPSGPPSLLASQLQHQTPHFHNDQQEKERLRFQTELEFVQCLGNPNYLNFLAQRNYFKDPTFINYLNYLLYWKEPQYVKFIKYPVCLHFLELLQHETFRKEIINSQVMLSANSILIFWMF